LNYKQRRTHMRSIAFRFARSVYQVAVNAKLGSSPRRVLTGLLFCCTIAPSVLADSITYQQLRQSRGGRAVTLASLPTVARKANRQIPQQDPASQVGGVAQESSSHPEFVRLPDGRIVRYGPGIICDENCIDPVAPAAFRGPGNSMWWAVPPVIGGAALCAFLCGSGGNEGTPQSTPNIIIPTQPSPAPTGTPTVGPTPPPQEIPEPSTLVLVGLGLSAMVARHRKAKKAQE
jgi:hypothetical protein